MRKNAYVPDMLQGIRDRLDEADGYSHPDTRINMLMIAVRQLADLNERLHQRVVDLEKVQNERGEG